MELESAVKNQIKAEIGDEDELPISEQKMLKQKFGLTPASLSEEPENHNLPDFLKVKAFSLAMQGKHFKKGFWRHIWLTSKRAQKRTFHRQKSN